MAKTPEKNYVQVEDSKCRTKLQSEKIRHVFRSQNEEARRRRKLLQLNLTYRKYRKRRKNYFPNVKFWDRFRITLLASTKTPLAQNNFDSAALEENTNIVLVQIRKRE